MNCPSVPAWIFKPFGPGSFGTPVFLHPHTARLQVGFGIAIATWQSFGLLFVLFQARQTIVFQLLQRPASVLFLLRPLAVRFSSSIFFFKHSAFTSDRPWSPFSSQSHSPYSAS